MIAIIDYGLGNIRAFSSLYNRMNIETRVARRAEDLLGVTKIILPGVGAFDRAMQALEASGMRQTLDELVLDKKLPVLGICVGMQILAGASDEGHLPGLNWISGRVRAFSSVPQSAELPLPHMGWNDVHPAPGIELFRGLESDVRFYFLHSFFFECAQHECTAATTSYGIDFSCAVRSNNVYGVQFHPEKSHHYGGRLMKNFASI